MKSKLISALTKTTIDLHVETATGAQTIAIIIDSGDRERILAHKWFAFVDNTTVIPYTDTGTPANPYMLPLANFMLGINADIYVEHINGARTDFRKVNLKQSR